MVDSTNQTGVSLRARRGGEGRGRSLHEPDNFLELFEERVYLFLDDMPANEKQRPKNSLTLYARLEVHSHMKEILSPHRPRPWGN